VKFINFRKKNSVINRIRITFIITILLICTGFSALFYKSHIVSQEYDEYMKVNIELSNLSVNLSNSFGYFDMYVKTKENKNIDNYSIINKKVTEILKNIEPQIEDDQDSTIYLRNLNNMFEAYEDQTSDIISLISDSEDLNEASYNELVENKTLFTYMSKHSQLLSMAYLNYSNNAYLNAINQNKSMEAKIYLMLTFIVLISFSFIILLGNELKNTLGKLHVYADLLSAGRWEIQDIGQQRYDEFNSVAKAFNKMKNSISAFIEELNRKAQIEKNYQVEKLKGVEKDRLIKESQLLALQSQMDPHFLFNTLNTISIMAMFEDAENTVKLIEATSNILRYNLDSKDRLVPLKEEIKMIKAYVTIQQTRFQEQMSFNLDIDISLEKIYIPPMIIQPIVENAITHGLSQKEEGGAIDISIRRNNKDVLIGIKDNGIGMNGEELSNLCEQKNIKGHGLGIYNVKKRLELYFNRKDLFKIVSKEGEGTEVLIKVPIEGGEGIDKTNDY
jgi:sensor histidine kinase YesM